LSVILIQPGFIVQKRHQPGFARAENSKFRETVQLYQESNHIFSDEDVASNIFHLSMHDGSSLINGNTIDFDYGSKNREQLNILLSLEVEGR